MLHNTKTYNSFAEHLSLLNQLEKEGNNNYDRIQKKIKLFKDLNFSLLGNPLMELLNEQIKANYSLGQHIENCKLYFNLLEDKSIDNDAGFTTQLISLLRITRDLRYTNSDIKNRYFDYLKEEFKFRKVVNLPAVKTKLRS